MQKVRQHRDRGQPRRVRSQFRYRTRGRKQNVRSLVVVVSTSGQHDLVVFVFVVCVVEVFRPAKRHHTGKQDEPGEHGPIKISFHNRHGQGHDRGTRTRLGARQGADQPDVRLAKLAGERHVLRRFAAVVLRSRQAAQNKVAQHAQHVGHDHGAGRRGRRRQRGRRQQHRQRHVAQSRIGRVAHVRPTNRPTAPPTPQPKQPPEQSVGGRSARPQPDEGRSPAGQGRTRAPVAVRRRTVVVLLRQTGTDGLRVGDGSAGPRRREPVARRPRVPGRPDPDAVRLQDGHRLPVVRHGQRFRPAGLAPRVHVHVRHDRHSLRHGRDRRLGRRAAHHQRLLGARRRKNAPLAPPPPLAPKITPPHRQTRRRHRRRSPYLTAATTTP